MGRHRKRKTVGRWGRRMEARGQREEEDGEKEGESWVVIHEST